MRTATMATPMSMACTASCTAYRPRPPNHAKARRVGTRLTAFALAALALLLMLYGERWLLEQGPAATNELTVATCVVDAVYREAGPANACASDSINDQKESAE